MTWNRSREETLGLPINALALQILSDYKAENGWNWQNWMRGAEQLGTARDREVGAALAEGWGWLMAHGLVVRDPSQASADAYRISRLGDEALLSGVDRLEAAERLGVSLHPRLAQRVQRQFLLGEYELAVFAAMREVEIRVRELGKYADSQLGVSLMQNAFSPSAPGPLVDSLSEKGEQEAIMNLFKGAIGFFKNPASHRAVSYDDPVMASEVVLFADLLLRILDRLPKD